MGELPLTPPRPRLLGAVLAAGSGTRMGGPKALLEVDGRTLLDRAVVALHNGGCDAVVAVVPAGMTVSNGVASVENPLADSGMRSSLHCALSAAGGYDGLAVTLVDTPGVGAPAVDAAVTAWRAAPAGIVVAVYNGRRGHPTVMSPRRWTDALALAGPDEGARAYLRVHAADVVEVPVPGDPTDLDTPADLAHWLATPHPPA